MVSQAKVQITPASGIEVEREARKNAYGELSEHSR